MWTLYQIVNTTNGKTYIGITTRFFARMQEHLSGRGSTLIGRAVKKYGRNAIKHHILAVCESEQATKLLEADQIRRAGSKVPHGYNLTDGGEGSRGVIPSDDTRRRMSEARTRLNKGHKHSEATKAKIGDKHRGKTISQEARAKMSVARLANGNPRARQIVMDHVAFESFKAASDATGINYTTLVDRFRRWGRNGTFPNGYGYI